MNAGTMKTASVTGVTGQRGAYPAEVLLDKGDEVRRFWCKSALLSTIEARNHD